MYEEFVHKHRHFNITQMMMRQRSTQVENIETWRNLARNDVSSQCHANICCVMSVPAATLSTIQVRLIHSQLCKNADTTLK